ncbi:MAG: hypothetical protein STSR0004_19510 [Peptococcaceae bacterium]
MTSLPWVGDELLPGVIVKRAEKDDRIVGAIVFDFSRRDKKILLELLPFLEEIPADKYTPLQH